MTLNTSDSSGDERTPTVGDIIVDRDETGPDRAVVINTPQATCEEWTAYDDVTVADDNPAYPSDASVAVVVYLDDLNRHHDDWTGDQPLPLADVNPPFYSFPEPRLEVVGELATTPDGHDDHDNHSDHSNDDLPGVLADVHARLEDMPVSVDQAGDRLAVSTTLGEEIYHVSPDGDVSGDGPLHGKLAGIVAEVIDD